MNNTLRQPIASVEYRTVHRVGEPGMTAMLGKIAHNAVGNLILRGQILLWQERVVARVDEQCGHAYGLEKRTAIGLFPIIVGILEAM